MKLELKVQIEKEIAEAKQLWGEELGKIRYLNNFDCNLPGGFYRECFEPTSRAYLYDYGSGKSSIRREQSVHEFWDTIDSVVAELEIEKEEIIEARKRFGHIRDLGIVDLILPIYIQLRELGYSHRDLTD